MAEEREQDDAGLAEQASGQGGEGQRAAEAAPDIGEDAVKGQTEHPAPSEDVGVPPEEELEREEEAARQSSEDDEPHSEHQG